MHKTRITTCISLLLGTAPFRTLIPRIPDATNLPCIQRLKDIHTQIVLLGGYMEQARMVRPGDPAKNFSLKDQNDKTFGLYEQAVKYVLLSFHPLAWTDYCAAQMVSLEENRELLDSLGCIPVGISVDSRPCKRAWADSLFIRHTRLLCDFWPHGVVAQKYGLFREENGFSERANVVVDENQTVVFVKVYPVHSIPDIQEVIAFIQQVP